MVKPFVQDEFDLDFAQMGWLDSAFAISYGAGQVPFGMLGDWFGPAAILGTIIGAWSLTLGATALATSYASMLAVRFSFGIAQAGCYANLSKATKVWFPPNVRTTVQGWVASFFGRSGGAMSNILFASLLMGTMGLSWQGATWIFVVAGLLFAVIFVFLFRSRPADHPWANEQEVKLITEDDPDAAVAAKSTLKWRTALSSGNMWVFLFQQFTSAFADNLYVFYIPMFLLIEKGVDTAQAGILASLPLFGGAFGGMVGGTLQSWFISRNFNRRWVRSLTGCVGKLLAAVFMFIGLQFVSPVAIVSCFFFVKFFGDWSQPTVWGTATDIGGRSSATVFSIVNTVGSIAGAIASPVMGALILWFALVHGTNETAIEAQQIKTEEETSTVFQLSQRGLEEGSPTVVVLDGDTIIAEFDVSKKRVFQANAANSPNADRLLAKRCNINWNKGLVTVVWKSKPAQPRITIQYRYREYGSGWTALFVALAAIYLASSLSWLWIDCTKTLETA